MEETWRDEPERQAVPQEQAQSLWWSGNEEKAEKCAAVGPVLHHAMVKPWKLISNI